MATIEEQIKELEEQISKTKYNKATEGHIGKLKAKIARLNEEEEKRRASKGGNTKGFYVKKAGNATVALVGFPSVGKSTLLNQLTGAKSEVGAYHFTTLDVVPGVMVYNHAKIQILDMPGQKGYLSEDNMRRLAKAEEIAATSGLKIPQIAMQFILNSPMHVFAAVSTNGLTRIIENVEAAVTPIDPELWKELDQIQ